MDEEDIVDHSPGYSTDHSDDISQQETRWSSKGSSSWDWKASLRQALVSVVKALVYAFALFLAAQRAFIRADIFFRAAALIPRRFALAGADLPLRFAQRCFIASEIRLRAAALIVRRFWRVAGAVCDFGGRPRRRADGPASPSSAEIA